MPSRDAYSRQQIDVSHNDVYLSLSHFLSKKPLKFQIPRTIIVFTGRKTWN